jgi:hypothetical protein
MQFAVKGHTHNQYYKKTDAYSIFATTVELLDTTALTWSTHGKTFVPITITPYRDDNFSIVQPKSSHDSAYGVPWWDPTNENNISAFDNISYTYQALGLYWGPLPLYQYNVTKHTMELINSSGPNQGFDLKAVSYYTGAYTYSQAVQYYYNHILDTGTISDTNTDEYYINEYVYQYDADKLKELDPVMALYIKSSLDAIEFATVNPFLVLIGFVEVVIPAQFHLAMNTVGLDSNITKKTYNFEIDMLEYIYLTVSARVADVTSGTVTDGDSSGYIASNSAYLSGAILRPVNTNADIHSIAPLEFSRDVGSHVTPRLVGVMKDDNHQLWKISVATFGIPFTVNALATIHYKGEVI